MAKRDRTELRKAFLTLLSVETELEEFADAGRQMSAADMRHIAQRIRTATDTISGSINALHFILRWRVKLALDALGHPVEQMKPNRTEGR